MADTKLTALSAGTPALTSLLYGVDDPAGTPASVKYTLTQIQQLMQGGLTHAAGGADAGQTMAVNTIYIVDISGYSADRTYTLPATAAVGDRCGIMLSVGDDTYELIITAASGDTLIGSRGSVAGGTEYTNMFITGETMSFRCTVANSTWVVEHDGRIPQNILMRLSTDTSATESAATDTIPTSISGVFTADINVGDGASTSNSRMYARRAGIYSMWVRGSAINSLTAQNYFYAVLKLNATTDILGNVSILRVSATGQTPQTPTSSALANLAKGDYVQYYFASEAGSKGLDSAAAPRILSGCAMTEVL